MDRFVITITPDTADPGGAMSAQTTVRVDTSTGQTRITELTVRAADGGGLAPADLPTLDLDLLIRALAAPPAVHSLPSTKAEAEVVHFEPAQLPGGEPVVEPAEVAAEPAVPARSRPAGRAARKATGRAAKKTTARKATGRPAAGSAVGRAAGSAAGGSTESTETSGRATRRAAGRAKAAGAKATAAKAVRAKATRAKATGVKATGSRSTGSRSTAAKASEDRATRAYRRMPEPAEVLAAYAQAGSITGLAEHYGVPRHTANGWARRLRRQGHAIGRS